MTFPSLFLSHGSPMLAVTDSPARRFIAGLPATLPAPRAILVISAHWETGAPVVNAVAQNPTIHDFRGFPPVLYSLRYPAPGDTALAERVSALLGRTGLPVGIDEVRGLDHGAWVPLLVAWPEAEIPVVQLSVQTHRGPEHAYNIGRALAPLREEGVLVIGSGSFTHNLMALRNQAQDAPPTPDVVAFSDWMDDAITRGDIANLIDYASQAPYAHLHHPTEEHLLPLFTAIGAGGEKDARLLHRSTEYAVLRMDSYAFGTA